MRGLMLCFLAVAVLVVGLPIAAKNGVANEGAPRIEVFRDGSVCKMDVEEYVACVLAHEVEDLKELEALKSLTVAARSSALYITLYGCKHASFDVCDDKNCCFGLGDLDKLNESDVELVREAVEATRGLALTVESYPAMALYCECASSGSRDNQQFLYLTAVAEEKPCEEHVYEVFLEKDLFFEQIGSEKGEFYLVYGKNSKCDFAIIDGIVVMGSDIAKKLELKSSEIIIEQGDEVKCLSFGEGHGYGLSLCGAKRMAKIGLGYEKILEFYFPKLSLDKIYAY